MVKPRGYWTKERCQAEALKYTTHIMFFNKARGGYNAVYRNGWFESMCGHMAPKQIARPPGYWTKRRCKTEALKYTVRNKFYKLSSGAYNAARANGWLDTITSHMDPKIKWTKEVCHQEALKYDNKRDFGINSTIAYQKACRQKWIKEICSHMTSPRKPRGYWSKERCKEVAARYTTWMELRINEPNAHTTIYANKWQNEICDHLYVSAK